LRFGHWVAMGSKTLDVESDRLCDQSLDLFGAIPGGHTPGEIGHERGVRIPGSLDDHQVIAHPRSTLPLQAGLPKDASQRPSFQIRSKLTGHGDRSLLDGVTELAVAADLTVEHPSVLPSSLITSRTFTRPSWRRPVTVQRSGRFASATVIARGLTVAPRLLKASLPPEGW